MIDVKILKLMEQDKQKIKDGSLSFKQRFSFAPVSEGDIYLFKSKRAGVGLEWLVVRSCFGDNDLVLLAPVDCFCLFGTPDLKFSIGLSKREMVVRCGETDWFPRFFLKPANRVGAIGNDLITLVKKKLANLARAEFPQDDNEEFEFDDLDPNYGEWMSFVSEERVYLLEQVQNIICKEQTSIHIISPRRLENNFPKELTYQPELFMAASDGSSFFEDDNNEKSVKQDGFLKHFEIDFSDGLLFLIFNDRGLEGRWKGTYGTAPKLSSKDLEQCDWVAGPEAKLHSTKRRIPWKEDGKIILEIKKNNDSQVMEFSR